METQNKVPVNNIIQMIPVTEIIPDPKQPRQTFERIPLDELRESIKADGIFQSLLVRRNGNKYKLVSGERRYRIAVELGIKEVPAIIIEANDDRALRIQLKENLNREDLLPMEQALGFRTLAEKCQMSLQEIAVNFGKTVYFIRQQIRLTELILPWQKMIIKNAMALSIALQISSLPKLAQKDLYSSHVSEEDEKSESPHIQISQYTLNKYKGLLSEACFDMKDPELDKKMGACTVCPFNTATNSLFPEEEQQPRCNNLLCFKNKSILHQAKEFQKAKADPAIVMIYEAHSFPDELKKLKSDGHDVLKLGYSDDCKEIKEPQKPDWEEFEKWGKRQNLSNKKIKENFQKAQEDYEFNKETFDKNIANGKYKKAFVAYDQNERQTGKYIHVELNAKKGSAKDAQKAITDGQATVQDIDNEIDRLKTRAVRNQELAGEKVHEKIVEAIKDCKPFSQLPNASNRTDQLLIIFLLLESTSFNNRPIIQKVIKSKELFNYSDPVKFLKCLESLSKQEIAFLIRHIILDKYGSNLPSTSGGFMVRKMAESLPAIPITEFEKEQNEIAIKKNQRIEERITELKSLKAKIKVAKKPKPKGNKSAKEEKRAA